MGWVGWVSGRRSITHQPHIRQKYTQQGKGKRTIKHTGRATDRATERYGPGQGQDRARTSPQPTPASASASASASAPAFVITVTDHGAGISADNQRKLFKQVVQFNPETLQAGGGSGFGLYISKGIVDLHGGKLGVWSAGEGEGCTFTVRIPMVRVEGVRVEGVICVD